MDILDANFSSTPHKWLSSLNPTHKNYASNSYLFHMCPMPKQAHPNNIWQRVKTGTPDDVLLLTLSSALVPHILNLCFTSG